jgi:fermentation-respiration switch protein FrsA (DUF1100 family)
VVVTHGLGFVAASFGHHDYPGFFARAGFVVLVYDHPCSGRSDGLPRFELDPIAQQRGYSDAITYLSRLENVDSQRIGIWGTSYAGGHVLVVAANDRRARCVVSQAMTIDGRCNTLRRNPGRMLDELCGRWAADRLARATGDPPQMVPAGSAATDAFVEKLTDAQRAGYLGEITLRSLEWYASYEPGASIPHIHPTPLLMIVCRDDQTTPPDDAIEAFATAREPRRLVVLEGDHYDVYGALFNDSATAAVDWFRAHLCCDEKSRSSPA